MVECVYLIAEDSFTSGQKSKIPSPIFSVVFAYNLLKNWLCKPVMPCQTRHAVSDRGIGGGAVKPERMIGDAHEPHQQIAKDGRKNSSQLKTHASTSIIYHIPPYIPILGPINRQQKYLSVEQHSKHHSKHCRSNGRWQQHTRTPPKQGGQPRQQQGCQQYRPCCIDKNWQATVVS